jgi:hypothetical protein
MYSKIGKKIISVQTQTNQKLQGKKIEKKYAGLLICIYFFYNRLSLSYLILFFLATSLFLLLFITYRVILKVVQIF